MNIVVRSVIKKNKGCLLEINVCFQTASQTFVQIAKNGEN